MVMMDWILLFKGQGAFLDKMSPISAITTCAITASFVGLDSSGWLMLFLGGWC